MNEKERQVENEARKIGDLLRAAMDDYNKAHPHDPNVGFMLMMFEFGPDGFATYTSNAHREDMILAIEELLGKIKGTR